MAYTVTAYEQLKNIDLAPETVVAEVLQNVATVLSTPKFTVPLDRGFGLSQAFVDKPPAVAEALLINDVMDAIEAYEPRAEVVEVTFLENRMAGRIVPRVEVKIIGDE